MPNWCNNNATITFKSSKAADEFAKACVDVPSMPVPGTMFDMTEPENLFQHYLPEPRPVGDSWYDWRISNWGTKWPPEIRDVLRLGDNMVNITFETAWGPPIEWFEACGKLHNWEWQVEYIETGMAFAGQVEGNIHGITAQDSYKDTDEMYIEIAEHFGISFEDFDDEDSKPTP